MTTSRQPHTTIHAIKTFLYDEKNKSKYDILFSKKTKLLIVLNYSKEKFNS